MEEEIKRYETKQEIKALKALIKVFSETKNQYTETEILNKNDIFFMDESNIAGIQPKTTRAKLLFKRFIDKDYKTKILDIDYEPHGLKATSKYNITYLQALVNIFKALGINPIITMGKDAPLKLECKDFNVYLAPMIDDE